MKIKYKNKNITLPFKAEPEETAWTSTEMVSRRNPFSGQAIELPEFAAKVYDYTIAANLKAEHEDKAQHWGYSPYWPAVRRGLDWFRRHFAKEYMVLLD